MGARVRRSARHPRDGVPVLQPRVHLHPRAAAPRPAQSLRRFSVRVEEGILRALRGKLRSAHARGGHSGAHRDRLSGGRSQPDQQRAHRAPGRRPRLDRDLARGRGLDARRSHRRGLAAARGTRRERRARPDRRVLLDHGRGSPRLAHRCAQRVAGDEQPMGPMGGGLQHRQAAPVLLAAGLPDGGLAHARLLAPRLDLRRVRRDLCGALGTRPAGAPRGVAHRMESLLRQTSRRGGAARAPRGPSGLPRAHSARAPDRRRRCRAHHRALCRGALRHRREPRGAAPAGAPGAGLPRRVSVPRRNEPCPCGSARRYKDCHGKIAAEPLSADARLKAALSAHQRGRLEEAELAYREILARDPAHGEAIAREPNFAAARQNLARVLIRGGDFARGWPEYRWRLFAQGLVAAPPDARAAPLPASLHGRSFALLAEQGIGDVLFFLRFAGELAGRGALLAFRGDSRLHPMLARTGLFTLGMDADASPAPGLQRGHGVSHPWILRMQLDSDSPLPLALTAEAGRLASISERLLALGPRPWSALTWRGGVEATGPSRSQLKEVDIGALGGALRGRRATWISVQRLPRAGERARLAEALGAPVHDFSACNEDLDDVLALLSLADAYVGVSNANSHLRAGLVS